MRRWGVYVRIFCAAGFVAVTVVGALQFWHVLPQPHGRTKEAVYYLYASALTLFVSIAVTTFGASTVKDVTSYLCTSTLEWDVGDPSQDRIAAELSNAGIKNRRSHLRGLHLVRGVASPHRLLACLLHASCAAGFGAVRTTVDELEECRFDVERLLTTRTGVGRRKLRLQPRPFDVAVALMVNDCDPRRPLVEAGVTRFHDRWPRSAAFVVIHPPLASFAQSAPNGLRSDGSVATLEPSDASSRWVTGELSNFGFRQASRVAVAGLLETLLAQLPLAIAALIALVSVNAPIPFGPELAIYFFFPVIVFVLTIAELDRKPVSRVGRLAAYAGRLAAFTLLGHFLLDSYVSSVGFVLSVLVVSMFVLDRRDGRGPHAWPSASRAAEWGSVCLLWMLVPGGVSDNEQLSTNLGAWTAWAPWVVFVAEKIRTSRRRSWWFVILAASILAAEVTAGSQEVWLGPQGVLDSPWIVVGAAATMFGLFVIRTTVGARVDSQGYARSWGWLAAAWFLAIAFRTVTQPIFEWILAYFRADAAPGSPAELASQLFAATLCLSLPAVRTIGSARAILFLLVSFQLARITFDEFDTSILATIWTCVGTVVVGLIAVGGVRRVRTLIADIHVGFVIVCVVASCVYAYLVDRFVSGHASACRRYGYCSGVGTVGGFLHLLATDRAIWLAFFAPILGHGLLRVSLILPYRRSPRWVGSLRHALRRLARTARSSTALLLGFGTAMLLTLETARDQALNFEALELGKGLLFALAVLSSIVLVARFLRPASLTPAIVGIGGAIVQHASTWPFVALVLILLGGPDDGLERRMGRPTFRSTAFGMVVAGLLLALSGFDGSGWDASTYVVAASIGGFSISAICEKKKDLSWFARRQRYRRVVRMAYLFSLLVALVGVLASSVVLDDPFGPAPTAATISILWLAETSLVATSFVMLRGWATAPWRVVGSIERTGLSGLLLGREVQSAAIRSRWNELERLVGSAVVSNGHSGGVDGFPSLLADQPAFRNSRRLKSLARRSRRQAEGGA